MIQSQRAEQERFAEWLDAWYGIAAPEPTGDMMKAAELAMGADMPDAGAGGMARSQSAGPVFALGVVLLLLAIVGGMTVRRRRA